ncbi:NUDIX domain-containing protein [Sedimentibacter sp.]|uniref:NUDIX domain-containing protein n=1 Tax=Sedimentibacter sp. TaxID=1960295 RepID=UPI0028ABF83E|nr:NUDIX domain-containing protein [Sedimentibacter sp.]
MLKVDFYNKKPLNIEMTYVVIVSRYENKWVLVRHRERITYEIPGGHIEQREDYMAAAKRELYEETGATVFSLEFVSVYTVIRDDKVSGGYLFFADIKELSELPDYEMEELVLFDHLPESLTYPQIQPHLFDRVQKWLNLQSAKDEIWDVYDKDRNLTGRTHRRGDPLADGDYHLVVHVWIQNSKGEFLITKRTPNKGFPNMWESTGGSAVAGDNSLDAAAREVKEETGIDVLQENGKVIFTIQRDDNYCDVWLFKQDFDIENIVLQPNETCDARWSSKEEIRQMIVSGDFVPFNYIEKLFTMI